MALKDKVQSANVEQTTETKAPVKANGSSKTEAFKAAGAAERAKMSEDQKAIEGSKSDKVAFVCALGDPNRKQDRVESKNSVPSFLVVGYRFKVLEDTTVPFAPYKVGLKSFTDTEAPTERPVKAGEIVNLNLVETAMFISRLEYAGTFSGEGTTVTLSAKSAQDRPEPLPILNKKGDGSIKEGMDFIADMVGAGEGVKGNPVIKPEYKESFGAIYVKKSITKKSAGVAKKAGEGAMDIAAAFRQLYANK
jgi:hypothetical protein